MSKIKIEGILLSVSVGYAFLEDGKTLREMFTEAEDWMYREKLNHVPSNRSATIDAIIETINQKDQYSQEHSRRVSELSVKIAKKIAIIGEYYHNFDSPNLRTDFQSAIALGIEFITYGHDFHINFTNSRGFGETQFLKIISNAHN